MGPDPDVELDLDARPHPLVIPIEIQIATINFTCAMIWQDPDLSPHIRKWDKLI